MDTLLDVLVIPSLDQNNNSPPPLFSPFGPSAFDLESPISAPISTGHKKKSAYRFGPRDSLASRYRIGTPGSRRYRKWYNEFYLVQNLSETESATDLSDDWDSDCEPAYGSFALVLDGEYKELWDPFIDITEEQQQFLLGYYSDSEYSDTDYENENKGDDSTYPQPPLTADEAFTQIRNVSRRLLIRQRDNQLLQELDETIFSYSNGVISLTESMDYIQHDQTDGSLIFSLEEKFQRLLLHSLCEYYDLVSYSIGDEEDQRQTVVYKRQHTPVRETPLMIYLNGLEESDFQISNFVNKTNNCLKLIVIRKRCRRWPREM